MSVPARFCWIKRYSVESGEQQAALPSQRHRAHSSIFLYIVFMSLETHMFFKKNKNHFTFLFENWEISQIVTKRCKCNLVLNFP